MNVKLLKGLFLGIAVLLTGFLAFFIIYNAGWLVGDDAIVINKTGWGHFFDPNDTVTPKTGRFFPFAYIIYNILPLLGLRSVSSHFALHALIFVFFCSVSLVACYKALDKKLLTWQDGILVLSAAAVCISRVYSNFLDAYSTIWVDYTLVVVWALCCYYVHTKQSKVALVVGLLSVAYLTYCLETNFVFPFCYGIIGLLFTWKKSTKLEKTYLWSLIGIGIIFLLLYFFICFLHIEEAYDGSHGQEVTIIGNAIKMFIAQKVLWLGLIIVCWRAYCIFIKKSEFEFWDTILFTGCAYCCGCAIMKLNWVLYYSLASIFMVPAMVHFFHKYLGSKLACVVMFVFALYLFLKVPGYIKTNQKDRQGTAETIEVLVNQYKSGNKVYWYSPEDGRGWCFDLEQRAWQHGCLETLLAYQINVENYELQIINAYDGQKGIYVLPYENDVLFPNINETIISAGDVLIEKGVCNFTIVKIQ